MKFSLQEKKRIAAWAGKAAAPLTLGLSASEDKRGADLAGFAEALAALAPALEIRRKETTGPPALTIGARIAFHAVPAGTELSPFLEALAGPDQCPSAISPSLKKELGALSTPGQLRLFVSPGCPFCPQVARQLLSLAWENKPVSLTVIDGALFPEMAQAEAIRSVPTVLLDKDFRWTGTVALEEIVDAMATRDPARLGAATLRSMTEAGEAGRVSQMMIDAGKIFPALIDLLTHEKWPVRLGAMVVMETLADAAPALAATAADPVWQRFSDAGDRVQGDLLYVLGEIAPPQMAPGIKAVANGPYHGEVREAAAEAAEKIRLRENATNRHPLFI